MIVVSPVQDNRVADRDALLGMPRSDSVVLRWLSSTDTEPDRLSICKGITTVQGCAMNDVHTVGRCTAEG